MPRKAFHIIHERFIVTRIYISIYLCAVSQTPHQIFPKESNILFSLGGCLIRHATYFVTKSFESTIPVRLLDHFLRKTISLKLMNSQLSVDEFYADKSDE